jgi:HSP20 family protein
MNLVRWDPMRELEGMSARLGRLFGAPLGRRAPEDDGTFFAEWAPAIDVQETEQEYLVKVDLPAVRRDEVKVEIDGGVLTMEGERRQEKEDKGRRFHRVERSYGKFVRRLAVPTEVDETRVAADFKDGVLSVHLPKTAQAKPRAIDVKVA